MEEFVKDVSTQEFDESPVTEPDVPAGVPAEDVVSKEVPEVEAPAPELSSDAPAEDRPVEATQEEQVEDNGAEALTLEKLDSIVESTGRIQNEVREMRKLYHNEFAGRLQSMQEELDKYHEVERGRMFDGILGEVAKLYSDNYTLVDKIEDPKLQKQLKYLFLDMLQLLESNGVCTQKSEVGDKRNTKFCHVIERVPTNELEKHDTVAQSRGIGFYIENRPLIKEMVDVYIYSPEAQ